MGEKRPNFAASDSFREDEPRKLFIGGLSRATTMETMKAYFSTYGNVVDTIVMMDPQGVSRGFGFITFDSTAPVESVMQQPVHFLDNKQIDVKRSVAKHLRPLPKNQDRSKKVFLGGIPTDMTEAELKEFMSVYGQVIDCSIMYDEKTMKSRGFGFVGFEDESVIEKLIKQQFIQIKARQVEVKSARPRFPQYQLQQQQGNQMIGPVMPGGAQQSGAPPYDYGYGGYGQGYAPTAQSYGQPGPYGPQGGYAPPGGYGPPASGYGAPRPGYAAPGGYAPPQGYGGQPAYGAPTPYPGYGQPHPAYGGTQQPGPYGAPQAGGYPAPGYGAQPDGQAPAQQSADPPAKRMKPGPGDVVNGSAGGPPAQHPHPAAVGPPGPGPAAYDPSNYYAAAAAAYANYGAPGPHPPPPQQQPAPQGAPAPSTAYPGYAYPYPDPSKVAPAPAATPAPAAAAPPPANPNYWSQYPAYGGYPAPAVPGTG